MTKQLSLDQLEQLEGFWRSSDAAICPNLQEGLSASEARDVVSAIPPIELPAELLTWWGWHNGVSDDAEEGIEIFPDMLFLTLESAVALAKQDREGVDHPYFIRLMGEHGSRIWAECNPAHPELARILVQPHSEYLIHAFPSVGELVDTALRAIEDRAFTIDPYGELAMGPGKLPPQWWNAFKY